MNYISLYKENVLQMVFECSIAPKNFHDTKSWRETEAHCLPNQLEYIENLGSKMFTMKNQNNSLNHVVFL
jgi:hypothetical protein